MDFLGFKLGFSWACGAMPNMSSVIRHSLGCIYICVIIYVVVQLILVLQVAVVCLFCACSVLFLWLVSGLD